MIIKEFQGENSLFSNFWFAPAKYDDVVYPTREHAYQASKAFPSFQILVVDKTGKEMLVNYRQAILDCKKPWEAKRLGRRAKLRPNWEVVKYSTMYEIVLDCFIRNPEMKRKLLGTGDDILQEGNRWGDTDWGIDLGTGKGENNLGKILMLVRGKLREA